MSGVIELRGTRTAYDQRGTGLPLLLIHGAEATRESFAALAQALVRHACVVTYDQRGCGDTTGGDAEHHLPDLAEDAAALMTALGHGRYAVMGTSLGGRIAQALALANPERVRALVLCNTWPLDAGLATLHPEGVATLQALRAGLPATARALAERFYTPAHVAAHPALVQRFARPAGNPRRALLAAEVQALPAERITSPTLCLSGTEDRVVPPAVVQTLAQRIPGARCERLPQVGHSAAVQAPDLLAQRIAAFLEHQAPLFERPLP